MCAPTARRKMQSYATKLIELAVSESVKSNCVRRKVGAVIARDGQVLVSAYNGVDSSFVTCIEAGCPRCGSSATAGFGYEYCICVHAEQSAIATAARRGIRLAHASAYVSVRPCLSCITIMRQSGIREVCFKENWTYPEAVENIYWRLAREFKVFETIENLSLQG